MNTRVETDAKIKGDFCPELDALSRWGPTKPLLADARPTDGKEWERAVARMELEGGMEPCPFCGATADAEIFLFAEETWRGRGWRVKCYGCQATGPTELSHAKSIDAWNKPARVGGKK